MSGDQSESESEGHSIWWWIFCAPGAAALHIDYLFPKSVTGSFGSARRRKVVPLQFFYTIILYAMLALAVTHMEQTEFAFKFLVLSPIHDLIQILRGS